MKMADPTSSTTVRVAQTLGITTSAFLAGSLFAFSYGACPALLHAPPSLLVRQWKTLFERGKAAGPALAALASLAHVYLAVRNRSQQQQQQQHLLYSSDWRLYGIAAAATFSIVPYTLLFMADVNGKLLAKAAEVVSAAEVGSVEFRTQEASTKQLLDRWGVLNLGRAALPLVGAVVGMWAAIS